MDFVSTVFLLYMKECLPAQHAARYITLPTHAAAGYACCRFGHCTRNASAIPVRYRMRPVSDSDVTRAMLSTYAMRVSCLRDNLPYVEVLSLLF